MGATDFLNYAYGKTPREAFLAAREEAQYQHGHGGYTGTIAEKHGFVHFDTGGLRPLAFFKLLEEAQEFLYRDSDYMVKAARAHGVGKLKRWQGKTLKQWEAEQAREQRKIDRFWARVERGKPGLRKLIERAQGIYESKWGDALCFGPITGKVEQEIRARGYAPGLTCKTVTERQGTMIIHRSVPAKARGTKLWLFTGIASE